MSKPGQFESMTKDFGVPQPKSDGVNLVTCPKWADNFGYDGFGAYADILVGSSGQRFRFVKMSSTTKSDVGIWVGDTLVSQALWVEAKMRNESYYQGDPHRAVERVTYYEASFAASRLGARLPTLNEFKVVAHDFSVNLNGSTYVPPFSHDHRRGPSSANNLGIFDIYDPIRTWVSPNEFCIGNWPAFGRAIGAAFSDTGSFISFQEKVARLDSRSPMIGVRLVKE